ncbi:MAG: restriction endonuclease subunit S [Nostoc sp. JL31]|uniref:restriction endonuclease subunit S n=1 Tax=Nostoc sp. JL31 TaxID=2815395 RepID=UPI0025FC3B86|nr:restriction endonuclease subunit S [Nostoc sp. JL31]MBN3892706.1 restriction endonuclease subunit S [Nostoc sp. JL31]
MKRYLKYKDSGVEWLGEIPEHWELLKIKYVAKILRGKFTHRPRNDSRMYDGKYPFIQTGDVTSARKYITEYNQTLNEEGFAVSKQFPIGTLVMTIAANVGDIAILNIEACFPDSIVGFVPKHFIELDYIYNLFVSMRQEFLRIAPINTQLNLNVERIGALWAVVPRLDEQKVIARFLDRKLEQINHFITNKQRLIELLKEQKTAIVNRAVTKGLNPHAPMKPSGIEWLGGIPAHWEIIKLGRQCNVTKLTGFEYTKLWKTDQNGEIIALRGLNIKNNRLILDDVERISVELSNQLRRSKLFARDIVFPCTGTLGHGALIEQDNKYHINQNIAKITPIEDINPNFLLYMLCCSSMQYQINRLNFSGLQPVLLIGTIRNLILQIPPIVEQNQIVNWLNTTTAKIDLAIAKIEKEIKLIQEYRTTLISDAVTGKIDVRETSAVEPTLTAAAI